MRSCHRTTVVRVRKFGVRGRGELPWRSPLAGGETGVGQCRQVWAGSGNCVGTATGTARRSSVPDPPLGAVQGAAFRRCLGGVSVCFSERSRWGRTHRWMPSVSPERSPGRTVAGGSQLWRAGFPPARLSPGRPRSPRAARRSARSSTPSPPPDCPAAAAASRAGNVRCAPGAPFPAAASRFESVSVALPEAQ